MLLTRQFADDLFGKVLKVSRAPETEAGITGVSYSLTRFANNTIHQNVAEEDINISVRVITDHRTARATTNKFDDESIREVCDRALALADLQPPDPELLSVPEPQTYQAVERHDPDTVRLSPLTRAEMVRKVVARADKDHLISAGVFSSGLSIQALYNSRGLSAYHAESVSEFSVTMLGESGSGWAKRTGPRWQELGIAEAADIAARKAVQSQEPREAKPGKYTVILEPAAVLDLFGFMLLDFGGLAIQEQRSCLTGRVNEKVFGENIQIRDDVYHPRQSGVPFDGEGMPRRPVTLVEDGVVKNLVYSRRTAKDTGAAPTGHGFPLPNEYGEAPLNIVMRGENHTEEELIRSTSEGLLVTRLWYIREVDPYKKILTGMTRDGTFRIEGGQVKYGVKNFRFNQSLIEMLNQVEMMGQPQRAAGEESIEMIVPPMKVREFNFSSLTKF
jgi:predicted Zn-dependent protease